MTKEELEAIRARVDGATRGPWEAVTPKRYAAVRSDADGCYIYTQGKIPADTHPDTVARQQRDAQFIAAAREDVPALLAEVERLRRELDKATDDHIESQRNGAREAIARKAAEAEVERLTALTEETEHQMHLRIRAGYDKTVSDSWRAWAEKQSAAGFRRGVAAMREAVIEEMLGKAHYLSEDWADDIRSLPDPEDTP